MDYLESPRLEDIQMMWHLNYWDGPISGIAKYKDHLYYFSQCDENEDRKEDGSEDDDSKNDDVRDWYRRYLVYELSKEELDDEVYWHDLFRKHVGTHTDYDEDGKRTGHVLPSSEKDKFYDRYKARGPQYYTDNKVVGWFEL